MDEAGEIRSVEELAAMVAEPSADVLREREAEDADTARAVARFQAGDRNAFDVVYSRYFGRVFAYMRVALNDDHEAEDLTQQVFMKMLEALPAYEHRPGKPVRAWLFTIVRNQAINHLQKQSRIDAEDPAQIDRRRTATAIPLTALTWLTDGNLLTFIELLPLSQRQVLFMRHMLDLTNAEIASILKRTPADVRLLHHRAMKFLYKRLISLSREPGSEKPAHWQRTTKHANVLRARRFALD